MTLEDFQKQFDKGWQLRNEGKIEEVVTLAENHLSLAQAQGNQAAEALFLKLFAQVHADQDNLRDALSYYKRLEKVYISLGDLPKQMHALRHIGSTFLALEEHQCAQKCLIQVVNAYEAQPPHPLEVANTHRLYALALEKLENKTEAHTYWEQAKSIYQSLGIEEGVKECEGYLKL